MPKAKKLKSGSWNCLVYAGKSEDGKRKYESFTVRDPTRAGKRECERMALEWLESRRERSSREMTVKDIIQKYIDLKEKVLSPSTISHYDQIMRTSLDGIAGTAAGDLTQATVQGWINTLSARNTPKYVRNANGLLQSSLKFAGLPSIPVTLPAPQDYIAHVPDDGEVKRLIDYIVSTTYDDTRRDMRPRYELKVAVMLAAFGSLRRGEICALRTEDFDPVAMTVRVTRDVVKDVDGYWVTKPTPKTSSSNRVVELPAFVFDEIDLSRPGTIIKGTPDQITNRFRRAVRFSRVQYPFRFHDLRHYYVSIAHALGIPDAYIMEMGGWKTDRTMKRVYRATLADRSRIEREKMSSHFTAAFAQDPEISSCISSCIPCKTSCIDGQKHKKSADPVTEIKALKTPETRVNTEFFDDASILASLQKNGDDGIRTRDLSVANAALSQLSYVPIVSPDR